MTTLRAIGLLLLLCCVCVSLGLAQSAAQPAASASATAQEAVKAAEKLNDEGKQDEALALYRQILQKSPDSYEAHLGAGVVLDLKGEYDEARKHLARAIELAPATSQGRAQRTMAMSYAFEKKAAEAAKYEKQVFDERLAKQDFQGAAGIANELARLFLESDDLDNAEQWYRTGHQTALRKPGITEAERALWDFRWEHAQARLAARRGQRQQAQKHVAAAKMALDKANDPDQAPYFPYLTGYVAFYGGDYKTALGHFQKADQKDPFILSLMAQTYEKLGDPAKAKDYYRKVLQSNIHNPTNAFARPLARQRLAASNQ